jgi:hypothetical protein
MNSSCLARRSSDHQSMDPDIYQIHTKAAGPTGKLPVTEDLLLNRPSGDLFGMTMDAGMGLNPAELGRKQFLVLSTLGGVRAPDGRARLSHGPLGDRAPRPGGGAGASRTGLDSLRRVRL